MSLWNNFASLRVNAKYKTLKTVTVEDKKVINIMVRKIALSIVLLLQSDHLEKVGLGYKSNSISQISIV